MTKPREEVSCCQALTELWDAIVELIPFPCDPDWKDAFAVNVCPRPSNRRPGGEFKRQPIVIRFGKRGLGMYQCASDATRQRTPRRCRLCGNDDAACLPNLGLHSSRARDVPFVIDCELVFFRNQTDATFRYGENSRQQPGKPLIKTPARALLPFLAPASAMRPGR